MNDDLQEISAFDDYEEKRNAPVLLDKKEMSRKLRRLSDVVALDE